MSDRRNISELWTQMKTTRDKYKPQWDDIAKYSGITVDPDYLWGNNHGKEGTALDQFVDDPTTAISVNQFGDYLVGILWGTGEKAVDIVPSRYVLELDDKANLDPWYAFATDQFLYHMNHSDAGFNTALKPYAYDQASFGTSGIGLFLNQSYLKGIEDNAFVFRQYGIDNTCIAEGKSGLPEIVGAVHSWKMNRITSEFCTVNGVFDKEKLAKLPDQIQKAYQAKDYNTEFKLVNLIFPREDFDPKLKGARGTRYRGVWFMEDDNKNKIFFEESFAERPVSMCRQIKVRGQVYGRSSGTMLTSTIRSVNFMVGTVIEILEKMSNPSLGIFNNAIFGDSVLDSSPSGLTVFNQALAGASQNPIFPLHDVGDPTGIIEFLIPYLNQKLVTAFKIDALLDFNSQQDMTATESLQRYTIRGKSISGMLTQQKIELLDPTCKRGVSLLMQIGELGVNPNTDAARAKMLREKGREQRIIPPAVLEVMAKGRPWYELKFNNELEKLVRTECVQALVQILQAMTGIAALYPQIIEAVNWYKLLKDFNDNLDYNNQIILSEKDFKDKIAAIAQQQRAAMALQAGQAGAQIQKDTSSAHKNMSEARSVQGK